MTAKSISQLNTDADTNLPDNTTAAISPLDVRTSVKDLADSAINRNDDSTVTGRSILSAASNAAIRAILDLEAGTDFYSIAAADAAFQPKDTDLTAIAALTSAADKVPYATGAGTWALADSTAAGRTAIAITDPNADRVLAWDDSAAAVVPIALADILTEATPAAGDFLLAYTDLGALVKVNWSSLPGAGGGISNVVEDTTPQLGGQLDVNGFALGDGTLELLDFAETASAVNHVRITNAATGNGPTVSAVGDDVNVDLNVVVKGSGSLVLPAAAVKFGASIPFADAAGVLTLQNVDALDATTESTIEAAIDTLANLSNIQGVAFTFGAYASTLLNNANEAAFKAAVNLEGGVDFQVYDPDLSTIAGLTATTDNFMQAKAGAWASRTVAEVKIDLGLTGTNSGDQTITLTGDVTGSGTGSFAATIAANAVTLAKMATVATDSILGRATAATGNVEVLTALPFAYTGDVTRPADSNVQTIANDAVTYAKMQNVSATDKLLGRSTAGAGDVEEIALTAAGRALIDDADAAAQRTTLGLVIGTNVQAYEPDLTDLAAKWIAASAAGAASLDFAEDTDNGTNYARVIGPALLAANVTVTLPGSTGTIALTSDITAPPAAATQAEQETGSSTTVYTSPGRQHFHPSACKCWGMTTGGGTPTLSASYNMTSITDTATGRLTTTIATDFSSANWCSVAITQNGTGTEGVCMMSSKAAGTAVIDNHQEVGGAAQMSLADPNDGYNWIYMGDQA